MDLHSTIFRFRRVSRISLHFPDDIYIPLFLDLDKCYADRISFRLRNLHSTIFRFRHHKGDMELVNYVIYIPLFLDLDISQPMDQRQSTRFTFHYF